MEDAEESVLAVLRLLTSLTSDTPDALLSDEAELLSVLWLVAEL